MNVRSKAVVGLLAVAASITGASMSSASPEAGAAAPASRVRLDFTPSSAALAACFPQAKAKATVALTTDAIGKDTFTIEAEGLKPNTDFTLFMIEKAGAPFGAVEYFGDFTTNANGKATNSFKLIVEEAFAFNNETGIRKELNSVGFWFADPADDDGCLGAGSPVTQFDGDASAGVQMMNSGLTFLP